MYNKKRALKYIKFRCPLPSFFY